MAKVYRLSKSQYCKGKKCLKALWLYRHNKSLADKPTPFQQNIFDQGTAVGELATDYFPGGVLIEEGYLEPDLAIEKTKKCVSKGVPAIFEAGFLAGNVLIRVDVLRNNFDGTWDLIEVKSTNSVEPKSHIDDVAIQKWVLQKSGIKVKNSYLMHLNREYIRQGPLDLKKLFVLENLSDEIQPKLKEIESNLELFQANLNLKNEPTELIGSRCNNPYVCEFKSYCWKEAVPSSIHKIGRINDKKRHTLMDMSVDMAIDIPNDFKLSANQQIEVDSIKKNDVYVDLKSISSHLNDLKYPLYFLDYESVAYAIPRYDDSWPHRHLTTQYSLHIQNTPGGPLTHKEFIHDDASDPSEAIAQSLIENIKDDGGSIVVYHKTYERDRTKELAIAVPELSTELSNLIDRMWDLEVPFSKRWYWDPQFNGSSSIKNVLPAFAPEFSYSDLEIQKGDIAQIEYSSMVTQPVDTDEREKKKTALLRYCERDTLAMVIILNKLLLEMDNLNSIAS